MFHHIRLCNSSNSSLHVITNTYPSDFAVPTIHILISPTSQRYHVLSPPLTFNCERLALLSACPQPLSVARSSPPVVPSGTPPSSSLLLDSLTVGKCVLPLLSPPASPLLVSSLTSADVSLPLSEPYVSSFKLDRTVVTISVTSCPLLPSTAVHRQPSSVPSPLLPSADHRQGP